jgi:hypothetical protein
MSCFEMKRGPGWGVMACNVETQYQNLNWISVLVPNFMNHLVIIQTIKKVTFQDICSVDPLWKNTYSSPLYTDRPALLIKHVRSQPRTHLRTCTYTHTHMHT